MTGRRPILLFDVFEAVDGGEVATVGGGGEGGEGVRLENTISLNHDLAQ